MSPSRRARGALFALLTVAACDALLTEPAAPAGTEVSFSVAPSPPPPGIGRAFAKLDRVRLSFVRPDSMVRDTLLPLVVTDTAARVRLVLAPNERVTALGIRAELLAGAQALFEGTAIVRVALGEPVSARIGLDPIAHHVMVPAPTVTLTALGDTLQLVGAVVFATGDTIDGATVAWSAESNDVVQVSPGGLLVARARGEARVMASAGELSATLTARVVQEPDTVLVVPEMFSLKPGETRTLSTTVVDSRRNPIPGTTVSFETSDPGVASVTPSGGLVRALYFGESLVLARSGSAVGSAALRVEPRGETVVIFEPMDDAGDWGKIVRIQEGGATSTETHPTSDGFNGGYRRIEHHFPGGGGNVINVFHTYATRTYDPASEGAIFGLDYSEYRRRLGGLPGGSIGATFAVEQGGALYFIPGRAFADDAWIKWEVTGLTAADFSPAPGPDFSVLGGPITFGFIRSNTYGSLAPFMNAHGTDNFRVVIHR